MTDFIDPHSHYFEPSFKQNTLYDLQAVVEHIGTDKTKNRYITIAKHFPEEKWFEYDDHLVREISEQNLLKREALFLFYVKKKMNPEMTHLGNHQPLHKIQERCHEILEKRFSEIVREKKYIASVAKRSSMKKHHRNHHDVGKKLRKRKKSVEDAKSEEKQPEEEEKKPDDGVPNQSTSNAAPYRLCGKWEIIRNNLSTIRGFHNCSRRLELNSKWQIVQQNLPAIIAMKNDCHSSHEGEIQGDLVKQPEGNTLERKRYHHFIQTSFRKSEKLFFSKKPVLSPFSMSHSSHSINGSKRNLLRTLLQSSLFSILYLDNDDPQHLHINELNPSHLIPNILPPINECSNPLVYISSYWIMKFLSFSDPGQLCNHDIACSHGYLKPHLHGAKKYLCVPIELSLLVEVEQYLHEEFSYPLFIEQVFGIASARKVATAAERKDGTGGSKHQDHSEIEHFRFLKYDVYYLF